MDAKQKANIEKVIAQKLAEFYETANRGDVAGFCSLFVDDEELTVIENG
jgi:hypothetical protein